MSEKILVDYLTEIIKKTGGHLDRFILIGGYASLFYHLKMGGTPPIFTTDLDLLMDGTSKEDSILKDMLLDLGFEVIISESGEEKFKNPEWIENKGIYYKNYLHLTKEKSSIREKMIFFILQVLLIYSQMKTR